MYVCICIQFVGTQKSYIKTEWPQLYSIKPGVILATLHTGKKQKRVEKTEDKTEYEFVLDKKQIENNQSTRTLNHDMTIMEENKNLLCEKKRGNDDQLMLTL